MLKKSFNYLNKENSRFINLEISKGLKIFCKIQQLLYCYLNYFNLVNIH